MSDYAERRIMMVDTQVRPSDVTKFPIIDAMLKVERENFLPDRLREIAYVGENLSIGNDRSLLDPRSFAKMLEVLDIQPDELVLDLGCGLGYSTAVIARLADAVIAVEADADMAAEAQSNLSCNGADNAAVVSAPLAGGAAKHGPYDAVIIEGAIETLPSALADQLKEGGRIVAIFMEGELGTVRLGVRRQGHLHWQDVFNASAPLLDEFATEVAFAL